MRVPSMRHASSIFKKLEVDAQDPYNSAENVDDCTYNRKGVVLFIVAFRESS